MAGLLHNLAFRRGRPLHVTGVFCFCAAQVLARTGLPAFPGAQGFGSETPGGRGGRIVEVVNLDDAGPGSLRQALEVEEGPRIVVFRTGGTVELTRPIVMAGEEDSYVTIAGQTAPGGGIQLKNFGLWIRQGAHDIVVRFLRLRPGAYLPGADNTMDIDGLELYGDRGTQVYNIVLDHNSFEWGLDENASAWDWVTDVTFQW